MPPENWCGYSLTRRSARGIPTAFRASTARAFACALEMSSLCSRTASTSCFPIVCTGLRLVIGSWKIIEISLPRICRSREEDICSRSSPLKIASPLTIELRFGFSPITVSMLTLLPEPDSPTMPSVRPASTEKATSSTAFTMPSSDREPRAEPQLRQPDSRIDHRIENIDDETDDDDDDRGEHDHGLDRGQVEAVETLPCDQPEPRQTVHGLGEDRPSERDGDVQAEDRHDRQHRVPQHVLPDDGALRSSLRARRPDVVLVHRIEHARPDEAHVVGREQDRERDPRQDQVVGPVDWTPATCRWVEEVTVAGDGEPAQLVAEEVREDQADEDGMRRDPDEHENRR